MPYAKRLKVLGDKPASDPRAKSRNDRFGSKPDQNHVAKFLIFALGHPLGVGCGHSAMLDRLGCRRETCARMPAFRLPIFALSPIMESSDRPRWSTPMPTSLSPNLPPDKQREMLRQMLTIRRFEERASADYLAGKIYGVAQS